MALTDLPIFAALRDKMHWHQARQTVLAQNVANADSPGYKARDIAEPDFASMLPGAASQGWMSGPARTDARHIAGFSAAFGAGGSGGEAEEVSSFETTPSGNSVVLEDEMMKVAQNQMDYQLATSLYTRGIGLLRTAIGRRG